MTIKEQIRRCSELSDNELWAAMPGLARAERGQLARFLIHLMEVKRRQLHVARAYSGLFTFLRKLGFSEWDAHARSVAVEVAERYRSVLGLLGSGRLTLSALETIAPVLDAGNHRRLLRKACRRSTREVQVLVAGLAPDSKRKDVIRMISAPTPLEIPASPAPPVALAQSETPTTPEAGADLFGAPLASPAPSPAAELYAISFTATRETRDLLERAKELLRQRFPKAGLDEVVNFALKRVLAELDRDLRRPPRPAKPEPASSNPSRYIPEAVKQEAWERDSGQCAFVASDGTRCTARARLEFDHELPFALGGSSRDPSNVRVYCFPHNQWAAKQVFGDLERSG